MIGPEHAGVDHLTLNVRLAIGQPTAILVFTSMVPVIIAPFI